MVNQKHMEKKYQEKLKSKRDLTNRDCGTYNVGPLILPTTSNIVKTDQETLNIIVFLFFVELK